jgi:tellurite methyltransferase
VAVLFIHAAPDLAFDLYLVRERRRGEVPVTLDAFVQMYSAPVERDVPFMISEADADLQLVRRGQLWPDAVGHGGGARFPAPGKNSMTVNGGYDEGYSACSCFWGRAPGSLVSRLFDWLPKTAGLRVHDAGCGEGKNAHAFAARGARVTAIDCSGLALGNARAAWPEAAVEWMQADIRYLVYPNGEFDIVLAYGLLHCLRDRAEIETVVARLQLMTSASGRNVVCAFNARRQDLSAHPGFKPCLLPHESFLNFYRGWLIVDASDEDLA